MRIKNGVRFSSPEQAMSIATLVVRDAYNAFGVHPKDFRITGGIEEHKHPSKHVYGGGLDFGTKGLRLDDAQKWQLAARVRSDLGDGFDVVFEDLNGPNEHIHVEYDPKT